MACSHGIDGEISRIRTGAPDSLVEMQILDAADQSVYKQHKANEIFATSQTNAYAFPWTPARAGKYTVNIGHKCPEVTTPGN